MRPDGQRFDERGLIQRHVVADRVHPATLDADLLPQPAAATGETDEVHVLRQVVVVGVLAGVDVVGDDVRLDDHVLADLDVVDALADLVDHPGELVAEGDGRGLPRDRVRLVGAGAEDRPVEVLVQVGAADAAPRHVDADLTGSDGGFGDVLDADVAVAVVAGCLHDGSFSVVSGR